MWFKNLILIILITFIANDFAFAQESTTAKDSTVQKEARIYQNIETYSERNKFTRFMIRLFFKPVVPDLPAQKIKLRRIQKPYSSFEGKIIRNINIVTLDPFGNSIGDTITTSLNLFSRTGNKLHVKTQISTVRNLLLFRENQPFDSLLVKESERLVRSSKYITDVSFYVSETPENQDSVDIYIRELDKWSIIPGGSISSKRIAFNLREENFIGLGHEFRNSIVWNYKTGNYAFQTKYHIPNFHNTFINSTVQYGTDEYGNFVKSFAVDRPFYSPFARWAAGVDISQHLRKDSVWAGNFMQFKYNAQDVWAGSAVRIFRGNTAYSRTTNLISAARIIRIRFLEKPPATVDTLRYYTDENFYLASIGISSRQYVQDKYIFQFGITEDVPVGRVLSLTGGYQQKNNFGRYYLKARWSAGNYYSWGYLSSHLEVGTFFYRSSTQQGVIDAGASYFTNMIELGNWKLRQFIKPRATFGIKRTDYDQLSINDGYGISGFYSPQLAGNSRLLLTSQTQTYAPWDFIGFHFGPYFTFAMGMLGDTANGFRNSKIYSQFGVGVIIKNDNLVMNAFQISLSFYPIMPGRGNNIFLFNSFQTTDFGFRDFEIGKPGVVVFR
jgi:hypothetical protein